MNILIPDSWLRKFLKTKATPADIQRCLSLCGPSVERIHEASGEAVYDIEVTTNRPDAMSVFGVAREAAVILPTFGIAATLVNDPHRLPRIPVKKNLGSLLSVKTDPILNPRWTCVVIKGVEVKSSPQWLTDWLTKTGIRPINTIVDTTNYLMRAYGQPAHAFDYDRINGHAMTLRTARTGEQLTTLDGKTHILPGDDIVIEDGSGRLIDLCGIMGGENSSITDRTRNIILFLQTYEPVHIRRTSMKLAHRTEAAGLFEKGIDSELVLPVLVHGIELVREIAGATTVSDILDLYPKPFSSYQVSVAKEKTYAYLGTNLPDTDIASILTGLGFAPKFSKQNITVTVPSWRRDVTIDVDIIEEIARIYGYQNIVSRLPSGELPGTQPDPALTWEDQIKIRLRDWGYTELYTYSMLSESQMDEFHLDKTHAYKLANPLSEEWVYMRPSLTPSVIRVMQENLRHESSVSVFELSKVYRYRAGDLPDEEDMLIVGISGTQYQKAKGVGEAILALFGCDDFASVASVECTDGLTILTVAVKKLIATATPTKSYSPIPKYPPIVEDISFVVPERFEIGPILTFLQTAHPLIVNVQLLDVYESTRTIRITYQNRDGNLTDEDVSPVRVDIISRVRDTFGVSVKTK